MNNQARSCKLECKYNVQGICNIYGECIAKDLFIEELEKIKEELHKRIKTQYNVCFGDEGDVYCFHKAYEVSDIIVDNVFEKYISELKGENK